MNESTTDLLWTKPEWQAGARAWIEHALAHSGDSLTGEIDQFHTYPWSTVMRVPASSGLMYFKASMPLPGFEARLTWLLAQSHPQLIADVVAADLDRGWLLTRDAGAMLRAVLKTPADLAILEPAMPRFAELQLAWAGRAAELLAMGVADRRLETLPAKFQALLAAREALFIGGDFGLNDAQYGQLQDSLPRYAAFCHQLAGHGIPISLHHDDFHDGNIFVQAQRITFSDWGDACAAHPFCSLLIFMRSLTDRVGLPESTAERPETLAPELIRLRDAYLEPFTRYEPLPQLVEAFNLAWRVGMVGRALSWKESNDTLPAPYRSKYAYTVPAWLGEFLLAIS